MSYPASENSSTAIDKSVVIKNIEAVVWSKLHASDTVVERIVEHPASLTETILVDAIAQSGENTIADSSTTQGGYAFTGIDAIANEPTTLC